MESAAIHASFGIDIEGALQSLSRLEHRVGEATAEMAKHGFRELLAPIAEVTAGLYTIHGAVEALSGGLNLGSDLQNLQNRTGMSVENLYELREQFRDAKVDVSSLGTDVAKMQGFLAKAANTGQGAPMLRSIGLDPAKLVSQSPDESFREIGDAIAAIPNAYARATVAAMIFHDRAAELLQVFMSPAWKEHGEASATAKMLKENAAAFAEANTILSNVGGKIEGLFAGMESRVLPTLLPALEKFNHMDFEPMGEALGNVIWEFKDDWVQALGDSMHLALQLIKTAFSADAVAGIGYKLEEIALKFGHAIHMALDPGDKGEKKGNWFGLSMNDLRAPLQWWIEKELEAQGAWQENWLKSLHPEWSELKKHEWATNETNSGDLRGFKASPFSEIREQLRQSSESGVDPEVETAASLKEKAEAALKASEDRLNKILSASALFKSTPKQEEQLQEGRELGRWRAAHDPALDLGMLDGIGMNTSKIVADSLARVGGGGNVIGPASNALLDETRRQTDILRAMNGHLSQLRGQNIWAGGDVSGAMFEHV